MEKPSVTEMDRGCVHTMDIQNKCQQTGNATEMDKTLKYMFLQALEWVIIFDLFQWHFHVFCTFPSIHFSGTSSFHFCGT